jgi:hypothetical protein
LGQEWFSILSSKRGDQFPVKSVKWITKRNWNPSEDGTELGSDRWLASLGVDQVQGCQMVYFHASLGVDQVQGCQMVYFHTKNPNLGIFWRTLKRKMLVYFMTIWNI